MEVHWIDPWDPVSRLQLEKAEDGPLPLFDPMPMLDMALGAALVSMRQQFQAAPQKISERDDAMARKALEEGARHGMALARKLAVEQCESFVAALQ
jgi:hypothetical protein